MKSAVTLFKPRLPKQAVQWFWLCLATGCCVGLLLLLHFTAALLLGSMIAAIALARVETRVTVPAWPYRLAQGLLGCLIARTMDGATLHELIVHWPIFVLCISAVIGVSTLLGALLARFQVLPGSTAVWGSAPGAATVMALMAESFGADVRLVAFMQFLRVLLVALVASSISRLLIGGVAAHSGVVWFPTLPLVATCGTLAVAFGGAWLGTRLRAPAGALLVPMLTGSALHALGLLEISLPPALLGACYIVVGWSIGLRFTREILGHAARALPKVLASTLTLIGLCGCLAYALHRLLGMDILTAYLATSPGGADSIAIIAASSKVDVPFVMAMQTGRFLLVLLVGPSLARLVATWTVATPHLPEAAKLDSSR